MAKSVFKKTDIDNLIGTLRGEVGEIIESWTLMRDFYVLSAKLQTDNIQEDLKNTDLNRVNIIKSKFQDEIISRLSELGYKVYGRVNFHFAADKLKILQNEVKEFEDFLVQNNFRARRNEYISHKNLPPNWDDHRAPYRITYQTMLRGIAMAVSIMKKFDYHHLGSGTKAQWIEMRARRYNYNLSAGMAYLLLPHIRLDNN